MKTVIQFSAILWIVLSSVGLTGVAKKSKSSTPRPTVAASPSPTIIGSPLLGLVFRAATGYATDAEKNKIALAQDAANRTIQSDCFKDWMGKQKMNNTNGRTSAQVVDHLRGLRGEIVVKMYYRSMSQTSAVASAYLGGMRVGNGRVHQVMLNSAVFNQSASACRWASTIGGHEGVGHSMGGYGHTAGWTRFREDTVPYLLSGRKAQYGGDVFDACCKN